MEWVVSGIFGDSAPRPQDVGILATHATLCIARATH